MVSLQYTRTCHKQTKHALHNQLLCANGIIKYDRDKMIYIKINEGGDIDEVRNETIALIIEALDTFGENINNWQ